MDWLHRAVYSALTLIGFECSFNSANWAIQFKHVNKGKV